MVTYHHRVARLEDAMSGTTIGPLAVRRSVWIDASAARVWEEFADLERMRRWFGTGHVLVQYECKVGATVETDASGDHDSTDELRFVGKVLSVVPEREITFEQDWVGHGWKSPPLVTLRLTPLDGGTLVELFHHGFEAVGPDGAEDHRGFEGGWTMRQLDALHDLVAG
jgi:uncharacterized protein YndB with AHSA1/START domain